jgi:hypothetical protein
VEFKYMKLMRREADRIELWSQLHEQYRNENLTNPRLSHKIILVHKALQAPVDMPLSGWGKLSSFKEVPDEVLCTLSAYLFYFMSIIEGS